MKRMVLLLALLATAGLACADAWDGNGAPFLSLYGGKMYSGSTIARGTRPGELVSTSMPCRAMVNITAGDVVALASADSTYLASVTKTTGTADPQAVGVALNTVTAGSTVYVATSGVVKVRSSVSAAKGTKYVTGGTAGALTASAAAADITTTPMVITPLQAKTISGGNGYFIGLISTGF